jgi:hypothetical protein
MSDRTSDSHQAVGHADWAHEVQGPLPNSRYTTQYNPSPSMDIIDKEICNLINMSMAAGSWKTYGTAVGSFNNFRKLYRLDLIWHFLQES